MSKCVGVCESGAMLVGPSDGVIAAVGWSYAEQDLILQG